METKEIVRNYLETLKIDFEIKTLEDITKLLKAHLKNFPFSSLKVLLKEDISLELNCIYENIVLKRRGGYCFEHNKLMFEVLKELGFDVEFYLARVVNNTDNIPPQTHRFTLLTFKGQKYIIDVGIGFRTPSVPVKFGQEASISHLGVEYKIIERDDNTYSMQLIEKGENFIATKFDLNKCYEADFEMGHFYSHKHPSAAFVNNLVISLIEENTVYSLVNSKYLNITKEKTEEIEIRSLEHFTQIIQEDLKSNFTSKEIEFFYKQFIL